MRTHSTSTSYRYRGSGTAKILVLVLVVVPLQYLVLVLPSEFSSKEKCGPWNHLLYYMTCAPPSRGPCARAPRPRAPGLISCVAGPARVLAGAAARVGISED